MKKFVCYCGSRECRIVESDADVLICKGCGLVYDYISYNYDNVQKIYNTLVIVSHNIPGVHVLPDA
jgi:hypothetical protein